MIASSAIARWNFLRITAVAAGSLAVAPVLTTTEGLNEVPPIRTARLSTGAM